MAAISLMQQARIAIREGRLVDARSLLRQVIREEPFNHAAWLLLARATPDQQLTAQYIERARELQPDSPLVQRAVDDLASDESVISNRRQFKRYFMPALVGITLLLCLVGVGISQGSWQQVIALQDDGVVQAAAAPEESNQDIPKQDPNTDADAREVAPPNSKANSVPESEEKSKTASISPTAEISKEIASADDESLEDSNKEQEIISDPQVVADADQPLPSAILRGMETEVSSDENEEMVPTSNSPSVSSPEGAADETSSVEGGGESEITGIVEAETGEHAGIQEEAQDLAEIESDAGAEEDTANFDTAEAAPGERWIDVNLTSQSLVAYEGDTPVLHSLISSGMWQFPTVTGQFRTWIKYESQDMTGFHLGYNYSLDDVPHVMYFFEDYAIHGAYWHNNFGTPMSHGCVNVNTIDAEWLYDWAPVGTIVSVHH